MIQYDISNLPFPEIVDKLTNGEILVYSTDTVMGIGCIGTQETSVRRLFAIKNRDWANPISYAFSSVTEIENYATIPSLARPLLTLFPGPVTLVLPIKPNSPKLFGTDHQSIGVRIPNVSWLSELLEQLNQPLATTSANISGHPSPMSLNEVNRDIIREVDMVISSGTCSGESSTVISCLNDEIILLREGVVSKEKIDELTAR